VTQTFNLTTDPWINVIDSQTDTVQTVSLLDLFANAQQYRGLAGEMRSQDLAILRFLLAILATVYSRYNVNGDSYEWLAIDEATMQVQEAVDEDDFRRKDLFGTWRELYDQGHFTTRISDYLHRYQARFDFFGDTPFYQVSAQDYDALVPENKRVANNNGTVAIKQINRLISESANSPAIFAPKTDAAKNQLPLPELVRWVIGYQNFTGVTDKTKIVTDDKFSTPAGWLYRLGPVYIQGRTLFETLMLNLTLASDDAYVVQKPVWEYASVTDYVAERRRLLPPTNIAGLYTVWSRLLHIKWSEAGVPTIFSAGIPMFANENTFIEPMTVWRRDTSGNKQDYRPAVKGIRSLGIAMWRNFGQYVAFIDTDDVHEPGVVTWLHQLQRKHLVADELPVTLATAALISDGNATSQAPVAEVVDDMTIASEVLFDVDQDQFWPLRIEKTIGLTQQIAKDYWFFVKQIATIRNLNGNEFANREQGKFYDRLNEPFKTWLAGLTAQDDRDIKIIAWKRQLRQLVLARAQELLAEATNRDIGGIPGTKGTMNIFTVMNGLRAAVKRDLDLKQEGKHETTNS
jgi:CRISPR system Cascade subunit CasA